MRGIGSEDCTRLALTSSAVVLLAACADPGARSSGDIGCGPGTMLMGNACVPVGGTGDDGSGESTGIPVGSSTGATPASTDDGGTTSTPVDGSSGSDGTTGEVVTAIDLHDVTLHDNPPDLADWPVTTTITRLVFQDDGPYVEFSKKDGVDRWPDITPPGWDGPLQYTLGLVEKIDGQWHASAAMQYWYGLDANGGNIALDDQIAVNWYYDARWGELSGYQPATGETIGVFVVAGNLRGVLDGSQSPVMERSDIVVVPMPGVEGAEHDF